MPSTRVHGSNASCWTCKLRRKRCDQVRPLCTDCKILEIACTYGLKPSWMDGGALQRQQMISLKREVKRKAAHRREKANIASNITLDIPHQFSIIPDIVVSNVSTPTQQAESGAPNELRSRRSHEGLPIGSPSHDKHQSSTILDQPIDIETDFIMKYLDYVFPSLFPFYRPSLLDTGRSWLLALLEKNKLAYHAAISLSGYFLTIALTSLGKGEDHGCCRQLRWNEVEQQTAKCFDSLKTDMLELENNQRIPPVANLKRVELLQSVIQFLTFETALGKSANWKSLLSLAHTLFEEVMSSPDDSHQETGQSKLALVLREIGQPLWNWNEHGANSTIWSPDQAGFRFCIGLLIFIDVVASTTLQQPPRLLGYHLDVLTSADDGTSSSGDAKIPLSALVGCRNWVIDSIAAISALEAWKQEQTVARTLPTAQEGLILRASVVADTLMNGIKDVEKEPTTASLLHSHRSPFDTSSDPSASSTSTLIWAYAAHVYLQVVAYGWQLHNSDIRANVAQIIQLLRKLPPYQLRAFAWPICVAGCLALEAEESSFITLLSDENRIHTIGVLEDVRLILEKVWQATQTLDATTWNLASCFNILGYPVLLV